MLQIKSSVRAETRAFIGGGGYSYIRISPDKFLPKSVVFKFLSKEISQAEHKYMNTQINKFRTREFKIGDVGFYEKIL